MGKDKKVFTMYKIRTMVWNAERLKKKYVELNEVDGPAFKIKNDPRFTKFGRALSSTGLDELPQLINIIKGEMAFVGSRPLPVEEALRIPKKYQKRFAVLPGLTSPWVLKGQHNLNFIQWMELDVEYSEKRSRVYDLKVSLLTFILLLKLIFRKLTGKI
jgi:lipopolysaccharide/colanic/teichoic acid biosynthesis glycosyltransferase